MKTLMLVLILVLSLSTFAQADSDHSLEKFSALSKEQTISAEKLINEFFNSSDEATRCRKVFLRVTETSADNAGWLWSRKADQELRSGLRSQELLFYCEVAVKGGGIWTDITGHYQQTLVYEDRRFLLLEQVWFSEKNSAEKTIVVTVILMLCGVIIRGKSS